MIEKIKIKALYLKILTFRPSFKWVFILFLFLSLPLMRSASALIGFEPAVDYTITTGIPHVTTGDLNYDGYIDLAISDSPSGEIQIFFNKGLGDGAFKTPRVQYPVASFINYLYHVKIGDLNGDGAPDLVATGQASGIGGAFGFSVLMNNKDRDPLPPMPPRPHGNVTFADPVNYDLTISTPNLTLADFNGDSFLDVALADAISATVKIYPGNGDGTFGAALAETYAVGSSVSHSYDITNVDIDNDGKEDLAIGNGSLSKVIFLRGHGDGTFSFENPLLTSTGLSGTALDDFNADGKIDIATLNGGGAHIYFGNGSFGFVSAGIYAGGNSPWDISAADFNHDTVPDLVIANYGNWGLTGSSVSILINNGDGTFQSANNITTNPHSISVAVADFDNHGNSDIVVVNSFAPGGFYLASVLLQNVMVTNVTSTTTDGAYKAGEVIPIQVKFNKNVAVTGFPQLQLETSAIDQQAIYSGGSGTDTLTFNYTVQALDDTADLDYKAIGSLTLNGGTIKNADNPLADADLELPVPGAAHSLGDNKNIVIDTTAPVIAFTAPTHISGTNIADTTIRVTDDQGIIANHVSVDFSGPTAVGYSNFVCTQTDALTVDCTIDITSATAGSLTIDAEDAAGNMATPTTEAGYTISMVAPIIVIFAPTKVSNADITTTTIHVTDSDGVQRANVLASGVSSSGFNCTQTDTNTVDCVIMITGSGDLTIDATDDLSNASTLTEIDYVIDTLAPVIAITAPTKISNINITNTTIEVTDDNQIIPADVSIDAGTTALADNLVCIQGIDNKTVDCTIRITDSGGLVMAAADAATNPTTQTESNYVIDITPPIIMITAPTKFSNTTITDTTIQVTDNRGILAANVLTTGTLPGIISGFGCSQTSFVQVDCSINITNDGNLIIVATDNAANNNAQTESGYDINLAAPTIQFTSTSANNTEDVTPANLEVSLNAVSASDIYVNYIVTGGTATNGVDYILAPDTLTIPAGSLTANIPISIIDDHLVENDETIIVGLLNSPNAGLGANRNFTYTITDNDLGGGLPAFPPAAPSDLSCIAQSNSVIRWNFTNNANNQTGFKLYGASRLIYNIDQADISNIDETDLLTNTLVKDRQVTAFNNSGESDLSNKASCYTLANKPRPVEVHTTDKTSISLDIEPIDGNPAYTKYAIIENNSGKYVQADGSFGDKEVWQTEAGWGGENAVKVVGGSTQTTNVNAQLTISLAENTEYSFSAKAKNGDDIETALSDAVTATPGQAPVAVPQLVVSKGVGINLALNHGSNNNLLIKTARAANGPLAAEIGSSSQVLFLKELLVFLSLVLIILGSLLLSILYQAKKSLPQTAKIKHLISQPNLKHLLSLAVIDLVFIVSIVIGLNHQSQAQTVPYDQSGVEVKVGDKLSYIIELENQGTGEATGMVVADTLSPNLAYVAGSGKININGADIADGVTVAGQALSFAITELEANLHGYVTFDAEVIPGSEDKTITNQAQISGNFTTLATNTTSNHVKKAVIPINTNTNGNTNQPPPLPVNTNVPPVIPPTTPGNTNVEPPITPPGNINLPPTTPPGGNINVPVIPPAQPVLGRIMQNETLQLIVQTVTSPQVKKTSQNVVTPILLGLAAINTLPTVIILTSYLLPYLNLLFVEPLLLFFRKKRQKWGIVYDSLSKMPIGLALVRLYSKEDNRLIQTKVTDKEGRYIMIVNEPGSYYLSITKPGYEYPSRYLRDEKQDAKYIDLYHGEALEVKEQGVVVTANIPLDPVDKKAVSASEAVRSYLLTNLRLIISYLGIILALIVVLIYPTAITIGSLILHVIMFVMFRRLIIPPKPKSWGIVYDETNKQPLHYALVRILDTKFNKLLETQVTDSRGRYSFLVGKNEYQLLAEKAGYQPREIKPVDLVNQATVVNLDVGLKKA